jgi:hypothetical protein
MVAAVYPSRAVERAIFRENFRNAADVARNGGTLVGNPVVKNGVTLDGTTQRVEYTLPEAFLANPVTTFVVEFVPAFEFSETVLRAFFSLDASLNTALVRWGDGTNFRFGWGAGGQYFNNPSGWIVGQKSRIVATIKDGRQSVYLNGTSLGSYTAAATVVHGTALCLGSNGTGSYFKGELLSVTAHGYEFTQQDVTALESERLWRYQDKALCYFDMAEQTATLGIARTLDKSRHGHSMTLGDGVTPLDQPSFLNPGFGTDGTNSYLSPEVACCPTTPGLSVVLAFRPGFHPDTTTQRILWDTDTASATRFLAVVQTGGTLLIYIGGVAKVTLPAATYTPYWKENGINVLVLSAEANAINVYLNGVLVGTAAATFTPKAPSEFYLGRTSAGATDFLGDFLHFSTYEIALSPLQVLDITYYALGVNA